MYSLLARKMYSLSINEMSIINLKNKNIERIKVLYIDNNTAKDLWALCKGSLTWEETLN